MSAVHHKTFTDALNMPLEAVRLISKAQNGVGAFILQCKRIHFTYCDWAGSSKGMNAYVKAHLREFAERHPQIEIVVSPRPGHPVITGHYINGREKAICVRNMHPTEIIQKVELLKNASGEKLKKTNKPVTSLQESVRGIWSPYHGAKYRI